MNSRTLLSRKQDYEVLDAPFVFCSHECVKKEGIRESGKKASQLTTHKHLSFSSLSFTCI